MQAVRGEKVIVFKGTAITTDKKRQLDVRRPTIEETLKGFLQSEGKSFVISVPKHRK